MNNRHGDLETSGRGGVFSVPLAWPEGKLNLAVVLGGPFCMGAIGFSRLALWDVITPNHPTQKVERSVLGCGSSNVEPVSGLLNLGGW